MMIRSKFLKVLAQRMVLFLRALSPRLPPPLLLPASASAAAGGSRAPRQRRAARARRRRRGSGVGLLAKSRDMAASGFERRAPGSCIRGCSQQVTEQQDEKGRRRRLVVAARNCIFFLGRRRESFFPKRFLRGTPRLLRSHPRWLRPPGRTLVTHLCHQRGLCKIRYSGPSVRERRVQPTSP